MGLLHFKSYVVGQTSSCWLGAKIPTLARPSQEGVPKKAGRGVPAILFSSSSGCGSKLRNSALVSSSSSTGLRRIMLSNLEFFGSQAEMLPPGYSGLYSMESRAAVA
ncbi:hypothetical protein AVEN_203923-1 [Araneus ventricosus]|uniref:Uncharacterized protein n=1 Tax=Araneus ventricosus TaxID=182803 RepID=A0A4Y2JUV0_ARAVE|nr:hypothetical protein AVEN_203923-1 [Araneus ventricosus]